LLDALRIKGAYPRAGVPYITRQRGDGAASPRRLEVSIPEIEIQQFRKIFGFSFPIQAILWLE